MMKTNTQLDNISVGDLINTINDAIIIIDNNREVVKLNSYAQAILNETGLDLTGKQISDVLQLSYINNETLNFENILRNVDCNKDSINIPIAKLITEDNNRIIISLNVSCLKTSAANQVGCIIVLNDLTEQYNTNEALREEEDKLRKIVSASADAIILVNEQGQIIEWNKGAEQLTGYNRRQVIFKNYVNFMYNMLPPEKKKIEKYNYYRELFGVASRDGNVLDKKIWDYEFINKSGELRYAQQAFFEIKTEKGYWIGLIVRDVTVAKKAELELVEKEKFQTLVTDICARFLNAYTTSIFDEIEKALKEIKEFYKFIEFSGVYLFSNDLQEIYPIARSEDTVLNFEKAYNKLPADTKVWWLKHLEKTQVLYINNFDDYSEDEIEFLHEIHGDQFKSIIDFALIDNGKIIGLMLFASRSQFLKMNKDTISILTVISEVIANSVIRRKNEIELKNNEEKFRKIVNATSSGIIIIQDNKIVYINDIGKKRFNYGELENEDFTILKFLPDEKREFAKEKMNEILSGKLESYRTEIKIVDSDNNEHWRDITVGRTLYNNKLSLIVTSIDVTERKKIQIENEKYSDHLEKVVKERTAELWDVNKKLKKEIKKQKEAEKKVLRSLQREKELNELKTRFISTASHEFKTPLTTVLSSAELLQRYGQKWEAEKYDEQINKITNSVESLNILIDDILDASRTEQGSIEFNPSKINLKIFLENLLNDLKMIVSNHILDLQYNSENENFNLDENLLKLALSNVLNNAIKYSPWGGNITIKVDEIRGKLKIEVVDEGIGIPENELNNVFLPFTRSSNVSNIPGTGLGLSITKKSIELHGGKIEVKSKLNKGTKFIIKFPLNGELK